MPVLLTLSAAFLHPLRGFSLNCIHYGLCVLRLGKQAKQKRVLGCHCIEFVAERAGKIDMWHQTSDEQGIPPCFRLRHSQQLIQTPFKILDCHQPFGSPCPFPARVLFKTGMPNQARDDLPTQAGIVERRFAGIPPLVGVLKRVAMPDGAGIPELHEGIGYLWLVQVLNCKFEGAFI